VVFGLLPKSFKHPDVGILLWCWLAYMNPHKLSWSWAHDFPFSMVTALAILSGLLVWKEPKKVPWNSVTIVLLIFNIWMLLTTFNALNPDLAWKQWNKIWKIQLFTYIMMMVMTTPDRINKMVWIIALSIGFYGFKGGIFTATTGGSYAVYGPGGSFIAGNNEIGLALIMTVPLIRYLQLVTQHPLIKRGLGVTIFLCLVSIIGTQSRGALLGMSAMVMFLILKSRQKFLLIIVLAVSIPAILAFMPDKWFNRMNTIKTYEQDQSAMGRVNAWHTAFNLAKARFMGGGFETFQPWIFEIYAPNPDNVHDVHSIYFEMMGEHGFLGLGFFLVLGAMTWSMASSCTKRAGKIPNAKWVADLCSMIQVSLVGYAVAGAFLGLGYFDLVYNLLAIVVVLNSMLKNPVFFTDSPKEETKLKQKSFIRSALMPDGTNLGGPAQ
jgi:probable O-glycosylation ligase (exosortase A-associated)